MQQTGGVSDCTYPCCTVGLHLSLDLNIQHAHFGPHMPPNELHKPNEHNLKHLSLHSRLLYAVNCCHLRNTAFCSYRKRNCFGHVFVHIHVFVHSRCGYVCVWECNFVGQRSTFHVFLNHFPPYFLSQGLSQNMELADSTRLAGQWAQIP